MNVNLGALMPLGIGAAFAILGIRGLVSAIAFRRPAYRAPAVVTDLREEPSNSGNGFIYRPVLYFTTIDGKLVHTALTAGETEPPARPGTRVIVRYDPKNPAEAELDTVRERLMGIVMYVAVTLLGVMGVAIGLNSLL